MRFTWDFTTLSMVRFQQVKARKLVKKFIDDINNKGVLVINMRNVTSYLIKI